MEMIDMNNTNALVALAYIKINDNPLKVFCNLILYTLVTSATGSLRGDELKEAINEKFGLDMPQNLIKNCANLLRKNSQIKFLPNGAGYSIDKANFNDIEFESNMDKLKQQETKFLQSMIDFVLTKYAIEWTLDDAKKYLTYFLDSEGNGAKIFLNNELPDENQEVHPSWYIGRYVSEIQKQREKGWDNHEALFLKDIINGLMIYQGIFYTNDYQQDKNQKFKDTVFYFDTKLVLRLLGYSYAEQVISTKELYNLITKDYNGKVGVFNQTINEVENIMEKAGEKYKKRQIINNPEIRAFIEMNKTEASILSELSFSIRGRLEKEFNIVIDADIDWNKINSRNNNINFDDIVDFIVKKNNWNRKSVKNDVEIISRINILRDGDYTVCYGGKKKLPIFITSNVELVNSFKSYVKNETNKNVDVWNTKYLPIVSDTMLLFRLWVPCANKYSNLPALTLSRYAYAAQNPNSQFFNNLREKAKSYGDTKKIDFIDIDEVRKRQLEDILIVKSHGVSNKIDDEMIAMSLEELIKRNELFLRAQNDFLNSYVENETKKLRTQQDEINRLYAEKFINKIGFKKLLITLSQGWWILSTIFIISVLSIIDFYIGINDFTPFLTAFTPSIIELILTLLDKYTEKRDLQNFLVKKSVRYVWRKYAESIKIELSKKPNLNTNDIKRILEYCLEHTSIFSKYKRFCSYE